MRSTRRHLLERIGGLSAAFLLGGSFACAPTPERVKNVVVLLVDQLRKSAADDWMPRVNELATNGIKFQQMRSVAPWTYPSVISLFSGLYPQQHGAEGHLDAHQLAIFDPNLPLLQKALKAEGYKTAAFVTNPFLHTWNSFSVGFDHFDASFINNQGTMRKGNRYVTDRMFSNTVNPSVISYFAKTPYEGTPEFTYVHYMDVHGPWVDRTPFEPNYEASVRYIDDRIVEMYEYFLDRYKGDVIIFVIADHGLALGDDTSRGFGERWRVNKASTHDFNLRIPFLILPSNFVTEPRVIEQPYGNVDFLPSIYEWLGMNLNYPVPGVSFMPELDGDLVDMEDRPLYARMSAFHNWTDAVILKNKKYMRFFDPNTGTVVNYRVFDVKNDPNETRSLDVDPARIEAIFESVLGGDRLRFRSSYETIRPESLEQLKALGYLE